MRSRSRAVALCLVAAATPFIAAAPAHAAGSSWLSVPGGSPLFDVSDIAPGDVGSAEFTVNNPQGFPVTFSVGVTGLVTDDNGCSEPEQQAGDTTCGAGGGELQNDLRLTLVATNTNRPVRDSTLAVWSAERGVDPVSLTGHESRTYRVDYVLPAGSTNLVQSDLVSFSFTMSLDQTLDSVVSSDPPPVVVVATPTLPTTGADVRALMAISMLLSLAGIAIYRVGSRRRRST